jgi:serine/threonine-protein kinase
VRDFSVPTGLIRLHLFGSLELSDAEGAELRSILVQPKRLGLLAYLAVAEPTGFHRRDALLALFWPEKDDVHARAALRRSLHLLRRALGTEAIVSRGDEVGIGTDVLWCDVTGFRSACAAGMAEEALALYRGDLLPGFFVSSAPDFERWVDEERRRCRSTAAVMARDLTAKADGQDDTAGAVAWARRAVALDPDDETTVRRLMSLLDRHGDRAGALETYEGFVRRLEEEFGLDPSPETRALALEVRSRRERAAAPSELPDSNPNVVAVLPFVVHGPAELAYLGEGLVDLVSAKLDLAGELRTLDSRVLFREAGGTDAASLEAAARQLGAGVIVQGSVTAAGPRVHLRAVMRQVTSGREARAEAVGEGEQQLFEMVDALVRQLLGRLSSSVGGAMARLAAQTTASLAALKAYLRGERAFRAGQYSEAVGGFLEATKHDALFALAHYRLAAAHAATNQLDDARASTTRAWEGRSRLGDHQRRLLSGQVAWLAGDVDDAEAIYLRGLDERPEEIESWYHLGHLLFEFNPIRGRLAEEARAPLERTLTLDPKHVAALGLLTRLDSLEGNADRVGALVERLLAQSPSAEEALIVRALRGWAADDRTERVAVRRELGFAAPRLLAAVLREVVIAGRDLAEVDALVVEVARLPTAAGLGALPHLLHAHLARRLGQHADEAEAFRHAGRLEPNETALHETLLLLTPEREGRVDDAAALEALASALEKAPTAVGLHADVWECCWLYVRGLRAAASGAADQAGALAERCAALDPPARAPELTVNLGSGISAELAWRRGDPRAALEHLAQRRWGQGVWRAGLSPLFASARERALRAFVLTELGDDVEAERWRSGLGQRSPFETAFR